MPRFEDNEEKVTTELTRVERVKLGKIAAVVSRRAKELCLRKTGDLARSIHVVIEGRVARIGSNLPHAPIIEMGAKPHVIRPLRKKALWWDTAKSPYGKVDHPGTPARPYLRPALDGSRAEIQRILSSPEEGNA